MLRTLSVGSVDNTDGGSVFRTLSVRLGDDVDSMSVWEEHD